MFKDTGLKISFLVVMVLLVSTIGTSVGYAEFSSPFREADARSSAEAQFVVTVSGTSVNFDWSAMVSANTYTMAVALADVNGCIDMSSLNFLDMGVQKTFSAADLPSGMIFYAAILAKTAQGQVVSNTAEFMPFAGTISFPQSGAVLMQVDDPGGIGTITVSGIINAAQDTMTISQISGDTGFGPFVLTVVDDKPETYTMGDLTMNFTYAADGTVMVQSVRSSVRLEDNPDDCLDAVLEKIDDLTSRYNTDSKKLKNLIRYFFRPMCLSLIERGEMELRKELLALSYIFQYALDGLRDQFNEDEAKLTEEYEACFDNPAPDPDPDPDPTPDNPVITIDTSCSIPPGAEYHVRYITDTGSLTSRFYTLNGHNVGPYENWSVKADGSPYLAGQSCRNVDGQLIGWQIYYYMVNGSMMVAVPYENGVINGHQYEFYEDGSLHIDRTMVNDIETYRLVYHEDGSLKMYCDCDGDGILHWTD
ncbi:MAG: hypothetical protein U9N63_09915 [Pseudomonadota bacterium]|nr:hypothetical protein [Pseudomonadota bacterium]